MQEKNIYKMGGKISLLSLTLCYLLLNTAKMPSQTKETKLGKYPRIVQACSHSFPITSLLEAMQGHGVKKQLVKPPNTQTNKCINVMLISYLSSRRTTLTVC